MPASRRPARARDPVGKFGKYPLAFSTDAVTLSYQTLRRCSLRLLGKTGGREGPTTPTASASPQGADTPVATILPFSQRQSCTACTGPPVSSFIEISHNSSQARLSVLTRTGRTGPRENRFTRGYRRFEPVRGQKSRFSPVQDYRCEKDNTQRAATRSVAASVETSLFGVVDGVGVATPGGADTSIATF